MRGAERKGGGEGVGGSGKALPTIPKLCVEKTEKKGILKVKNEVEMSAVFQLSNA